jgi:hypothetical protein
VEEQIMTIYTGTNGYLDGLEIGQVRKFLVHLLQIWQRFHFFSSLSLVSVLSPGHWRSGLLSRIFDSVPGFTLAVI